MNIKCSTMAATWIAATLLIAPGLITNARAQSSSNEGVPAEIQSSGKLILGTSADVGLPYSSIKEGTTDQYIGFDHDLGAAIAKKLGLEMEVSNMSFDSLIPSLQANRVNFVISGMFDSVEREKKVDFVDHAIGGSTMLATTKSDDTIKVKEDLCGRHVSALRGAVESKKAEEISKECEAAGKQPLDIQVFPDTKSQITALTSGRSEVIFGDLGYLGILASKQSQQFRLLGEPFNSGPVGIAIAKGSPLGPVIIKALDDLIADGTYGKIADEYGIPPSARITKAVLNGAGAAK